MCPAPQLDVIVAPFPVSRRLVHELDRNGQRLGQIAAPLAQPVADALLDGRILREDGLGGRPLPSACRQDGDGEVVVRKDPPAASTRFGGVLDVVEDALVDLERVPDDALALADLLEQLLLELERFVEEAHWWCQVKSI
jgi:hypothetical protein